MFLFKVPASVTLVNKTVIALEGENVTVDCISAGFPSPNVSWVNASSYVMQTGRHLQFPNISRHLRGVYNCSASNTCGNDSKKLEIVVQCESCAKKVIAACNVENFKLFVFGLL